MVIPDATNMWTNLNFMFLYLIFTQMLIFITPRRFKVPIYVTYSTENKNFTWNSYSLSLYCIVKPPTHVRFDGEERTPGNITITTELFSGYCQLFTFVSIAATHQLPVESVGYKSPPRLVRLCRTSRPRSDGVMALANWSERT